MDDSTIHAGGKVVGRVSGGVFRKQAGASRHMLRKPPAWALDTQSLEDAEALGAHGCYHRHGDRADVHGVRGADKANWFCTQQGTRHTDWTAPRAVDRHGRRGAAPAQLAGGDAVTGMPPGLTDKARLHQMPTADLAAERVWLSSELSRIGQHIEEADGWPVALYDQYAAILDDELGPRARTDTLPRCAIHPTFTRELLDCIRQATSMVILLRDYGIMPHGRGPECVCRCLFHAGQHPSISVNEDRKLYHCHACGAGGDCVTLVQMVEGCEFAQAVRRLAGLAAIYLSAEANHVE